MVKIKLFRLCEYGVIKTKTTYMKGQYFSPSIIYILKIIRGEIGMYGQF